MNVRRQPRRRDEAVACGVQASAKGVCTQVSGEPTASHAASYRSRRMTTVHRRTERRPRGSELDEVGLYAVGGILKHGNGVAVATATAGGRSRVEQEHAVTSLGHGYVRVAEYDHIDVGGHAGAHKVTEDMADKEAGPRDGHGDARGQRERQLRRVGVAVYRDDRRDRLEFSDDRGRADVSGMKDAVNAIERVVNGGRQRSVRVGYDPDAHR